MVDLNTLSNNRRWRNEISGFLSSRDLGEHKKTLPKDFILIYAADNSLRVVSLNGNKMSKVITITIPKEYPFRPPEVMIGQKSYTSLLCGLGLKGRAKKLNTKCACCASIVCRENWAPILNIHKVLTEISENWEKAIQHALMVLISKVCWEKIGTIVPIYKYLLDPKFYSLYYKFQDLPRNK
jgi:hypothetical protein